MTDRVEGKMPGPARHDKELLPIVIKHHLNDPGINGTCFNFKCK